MLQNIQDIVKLAKDLGYTIYTNPFKLNIVGIRNSKATDQTKFDDKIAYFYYDGTGKLFGKIVPATTDPAATYLEKPINLKGTAILKSGEYKDAYKIGLHRGKYSALVQNKPVTVLRDNDRNALINYLSPTDKGMFGINIHKASLGKNNEAIIDKDSAGCQVFQKIVDFNEFMKLANKSKEMYGNTFSYILLDERDQVKFFNTSILVGGLILLSVGAYHLYS
jgi:hypothetical protein